MTQLLSNEASQHLVTEIVRIAEAVALERVRQNQKRYLNQKEVMEEYRCTHKDITKWEKAGLKKFRKGKSWIYDRRDIEQVLESLKQ
ncbi:helix-turn-helix domain-containing protein [Staphylococcus pseudintermedius]|uniref:helix-turn-helix domain-containing protein n=1 Tax=Staphylococcus pseudintermedius TaxID=283734 RepID=UPI001180B982|nr:helix-turn-helix domain-containing protein [Staphylococcus pseudintermedius]EGQ1628914.1 helix-turn-helix domain-containing protein [Staphylococcus pseudintermedius]EGQ2756537.1 helix-turn-helix domain-containing protein [Staphylococcus pseudintermedius]EGQ2769062.1 helix-turn-helix domain-containing protein [Staphylococcus pseudintermedius]EGQ2788845.1 helix-turn-helix domain-containing protein [Staphylococcus pseudintermedius]EGQ2980739.1 DNA-binding protein [Staphylococcus pseudintermedi